MGPRMMKTVPLKKNANTLAKRARFETRNPILVTDLTSDMDDQHAGLHPTSNGWSIQLYTACTVVVPTMERSNILNLAYFRTNLGYLSTIPKKAHFFGCSTFHRFHSISSTFLDETMTVGGHIYYLGNRWANVGHLWSG